MSFTAVYDACVLHPPSVRDLLVRLGQTGLFAARWSETILDEMVEGILRRRPDLEPARLVRTRHLMCEAVPDCLVTGYERLIDGLELPDPDDRHVLAAAIRANAQVIVTSNLSDFPAGAPPRPDGHPEGQLLVAFLGEQLGDFGRGVVGEGDDGRGCDLGGARPRRRGVHGKALLRFPGQDLDASPGGQRNGSVHR